MIYFVRSGDAVKIGVATDARARVNQIQVASTEPVSLLGIMPGGIRGTRAASPFSRRAAQSRRMAMNQANQAQILKLVQSIQDNAREVRTLVEH